jgi:hypothetical protein
MKDSSLLRGMTNGGVFCNTLIMDGSLLAMLYNSRGLNLGVAMIKDVS